MLSASEKNRTKPTETVISTATVRQESGSDGTVRQESGRDGTVRHESASDGTLRH